MTDKYRAAAMRHPVVESVARALAAEYHHPKALASVLASTAERYPQFAASVAYREGLAAVKEWQAAEALADQISRAYHDPKLRAEFGSEAIERAWNDPATAKQMLLSQSASGRLSASASAALDTLYAAESYGAEHGTPLPPAATAPLPSNPDTEIEALLAKSAAGTLTKAEDVRLNQLYELRVGRDEREASAADAKANAPKQPSDFERLRDKSLAGALTRAEDARYNELCGERAVAAGRIDADDLEIERAAAVAPVTQKESSGNA